MRTQRRPLRLTTAILAAGLVAVLAAWPTGPTGPIPAGDTDAGIELVAASGNTQNQVVTNSLNGKPILTVADFRPGQSRSGQVTLKNVGSAAQSVMVWQTGLTTGPAGRPDLAAWVRLTVYDAALKTNVYVGTYSGFATSTQPLLVCGVPTKKASCPAWDKAETHTFTFTVTFPDVAAGAGINLDTYQSTWLRSEFDWTSVH